MSDAKDEAQDFGKPTKWELQAKEHQEREAEAKALASKLFSFSEIYVLAMKKFLNFQLTKLRKRKL